MKIVESKTLDSTIANYFYDNVLAFNVADSPSLAAVIDLCLEFSQQYPGHKYKVLNRRRLGGLLLEAACEDTAALVQPIMDRAIKYGET